MDIIVEGKGKKLYVANEVEIKLNFFVNKMTYDETLNLGVKSVEIFMENILDVLKINKKGVKTRSFRISENSRYDYESKKNIYNGFNYNQEARITLDYDASIIAEFMEKVTKLENPPRYVLYFTIKEKEKAKNEMLTIAYEKAKEKAEIIANAAGQKLKECVKVDFKPFTAGLYSNSKINDFNLESDNSIERKMASKERIGASNVIINTFTPEDIEIVQTLYCLWTTEK